MTDKADMASRSSDSGRPNNPLGEKTRLDPVSSTNATSNGQAVMVKDGDISHSNNSHANSNEPAEYYPEGGAEAWLVVLGSWFALFPSLGVLNSAGTFQTYVSTHQLASETQGTIGWIFSINAFMTFFTGIYIGPLFDKYGPRWPILAGTVLLTSSFVALSFSQSKSLTTRSTLHSLAGKDKKNITRRLCAIR